MVCIWRKMLAAAGALIGPEDTWLAEFCGGPCDGERIRVGMDLESLPRLYADVAMVPGGPVERHEFERTEERHEGARVYRHVRMARRLA